MQRTIVSILLILFSMISFSATVATPSKTNKTKKARYKYVEELYYADEEMFQCAVTNRKTHETYYGQSEKKKYAVMYARAACQMKSYRGQCFVKANCNWQWVKVRKRRYIRTRV